MKSPTSDVKVNDQLQQMLYKLKNKMQVEVQKRIENQRMLNNHLQEVSHTVT